MGLTTLGSVVTFTAGSVLQEEDRRIPGNLGPFTREGTQSSSPAESRGGGQKVWLVQWCSGTEMLVVSLCFSPAPALAPVTRGPRALVFLALDERSRQRVWFLQAGGGLGNRLCVCPGAGCLLGFPSPPPHPLRSLFLAPGKGRWTQADTCSEQVSGRPRGPSPFNSGSGIFLLRQGPPPACPRLLSPLWPSMSPSPAPKC